MKQRLSAIAALSLSAMLGGCGGPSEQDVATAIGHRNISNVSCAQATGQPGYVCTFTLQGNNLTRRMVKTDGGGWTVVFN